MDLDWATSTRTACGPFQLGENLHNNIDDVLKSKNSNKNMASDSENVMELNLIQDSHKGVQKYSTGHFLMYTRTYMKILVLAV